MTSGSTVLFLTPGGIFQLWKCYFQGMCLCFEPLNFKTQLCRFVGLELPTSHSQSPFSYGLRYLLKFWLLEVCFQGHLSVVFVVFGLNNTTLLVIRLEPLTSGSRVCCFSPWAICQLFKYYFLGICLLVFGPLDFKIELQVKIWTTLSK